MTNLVEKSPKPLTTRTEWGIVAVVTVLLLSQCVSIGFPTEGVVIDAETKKPMQGVWVSQVWNGTAFCIPIPSPHPTCRGPGRIASAVTQTDEHGRFRFARPHLFPNGHWGSFSVHPSFSTIMLSYANDTKSLPDPMYRWQHRDITIVMNKRTGPRVEMLANLAEHLHFEWSFRMDAVGYAQVELGLFEQMRVMGVTPEEWAEGIKFGFAYRRGELTKTSSAAETEKVRTDIASRAEGLTKWAYEPYTRYVDYLKTQEKP